ncbi:unnamed protein product [Mytilus coruscus]|uniref:Uncharacterized protein n=1 Tax=Mytilus coruscus TaxID=42192 RepID=A0A6J8AJ26_MYTCO|nr:unnamed protein product [Mytilus coruscus]
MIILKCNCALALVLEVVNILQWNLRLHKKTLKETHIFEVLKYPKYQHNRENVEQENIDDSFPSDVADQAEDIVEYEHRQITENVEQESIDDNFPREFASDVEDDLENEHQHYTENVEQENVEQEYVDDNFSREKADEAEDDLEHEHQQNTENVEQENVDDYFPREIADGLEDDLENGTDEAESSSDYETDDEQSFYEQFEDWDELTDADQSNTKRFLDENYTVEELQLTFNKYSAEKGRRPNVGQFRKFILRSPGMPKKRKSLVDMSKTLEEKKTEASELKMKLRDTRNFMVKQTSVLHNFNQELYKSRECVDKLNDQNEKVHHKNQELLQANTHMLQMYMLLQRDCNLLLDKTKEKDQTISDLSKQNTDQDDSIKSLTKQNNDQDDSIKSLTKQNNDQDDSIKSLKMENTKLQEKILNQGEVNFDLMKEKKLFEEENTAMIVKYTDLKKMNVKQKIELEENMEKDRNLKKQKLIYDELKSELCDTNSRLETVEKELTNKNLEINRIELKQQEEIKQLQTQVAELKEM